MAQNVGTPRFYIDWNTYHNAIGIYKQANLHRCDSDGKGSYMSMGMLNPTNRRYVTPDADGITHGACSIRYDCDNWILDPEKSNWIGVFGHNFASQNIGWHCVFGKDIGEVQLGYPNVDFQGNIVNSSEHENNIIYPEYDGFSMARINGAYNTDVTPEQVKKIHLHFRNITSDNEFSKFKFGAWCIGRYYDMTQSPDLSLKLSYKYDGVKTQQTKNGSTISNAMYTKPSDWGIDTMDKNYMGAWQLYKYYDKQGSFRSGRRVWDLSFSYLSDEHVFPLNASSGYSSTIGSESGYPYGSIVQVTGLTTPTTTDDSYQFISNVSTGTDFFSQVWNLTIGGALPFIFNPNGGGDNPNNSPDQFAICKFVNNSLQYEQVAHNVYNVSLKIEEVW